MDEQKCGLCGQSLRGPPFRSCSLDLCMPCFEVDPTERVAARGLVVETERWSTRPKGEDAVPVHHTRVTGVARMDVPPQALFAREGIGARVRKWLGRKELEVGDSLFDDAIFIETSTPEVMRRLLANEGLQGVIMEAVCDLRRIAFDPVEGGCRVMVHTSYSRRSEHVPPSTHQRVVAIALHYLSGAPSARAR